ncbi:GDSL-type esterase/lipase family protein [Novosphingobium sp. KCTC 2891]|uniref:GDSL-type esterase/lipase family protein n=1 Tax=Novosphingobium sp. KCTC 2891 TaxID=2989730 RepID=UPI002223A3B1|nr:GDSL-type esterase/lipase family protein [Novosphingobium sp. KCTC 2891]MCW1383201.1 GDSL-type esterase/lipase family protein [Novosphingobium sp. KCTC 2891]
MRMVGIIPAAALALTAASALAQAPAPAAAARPAASPTAPLTAMIAQPCAQPRGPGNDWPALCKYQQADKQVSGPPRAVFMGDSITEYWLPASPGLFASGVLDRGIAGQTSPQMLARFYQDVIRLRPRVVHIMAGTNDLFGNTGPTSPEEYANAITAMVDLAQANGIAVVLGSVLPVSSVSWRPGYRPAAQVIAINGWLRELAKQRGLVFADYHAAMTDTEGGMKPGLSGDNVHPTAAGYAVMEPIARAALADAEKQVAARKAQAMGRR